MLINYYGVDMGRMKELAMEQEMQQQNEAFFYFTLNDFENIVLQHGADKVLNSMRKESFTKLAEWFSRINKQDEAVIPALLKRKTEDA